MTRNSNYTSDSLRMTNSTEPDEVQDFLRGRIRQPYRIEDTTVFNFSNHRVNDEALEKGVSGKFEEELYVIPFAVTGSWGYFVQLLPDRLQQAEILVYKPEFEEYSCYSNLLGAMESHGAGFKQDMEGELESVSI